MTQSTTVVTLPQMVDLALNSPEVGIVNFTVLHSLLHVIVNQLELTETNVEFRGSDSERLQGYISNAKPGPLLTLTEYTIGEPPGKGKKGKSKGKRTSIADEKGKKDESQKEKPEKKSSAESVQSQNKSTIVLVETSKGNLTGPQFTVAVTKNHFERLEDDIQRLEKKIRELAELPGNTALIQALRAEGSETTPVLDMFQILNLTKRLDAAELAMEKVASMVEDLGKRGPLIDEFDKKSEENSDESVSNIPGLSGIVERVEALERAVLAGGDTVDVGVGIEGVDFSHISPQHAVQILYNELLTLKGNAAAFSSALADLEEIKKMLSPVGGDTENLPPEVRLNQIEIKFADVVEQLNSLDNVYNRQVSTLQDRLSDLEKEFNTMIERVKLGLPAGDAGMEGQNMSEMYNTLMQLQEDMNNIAGTASKLMEEREDRQHALDVMTEQVELLKTVKADREDLEDALAEKADACQINKKVSLEQFDAACGDMSKSIEEALSKLTEQEALWGQALDDIQKDVGNKLDRMELNPLRDFINKKLKNLQEKFKALSAMKKEHEAAGTKTKFLKNVNCISCDKDVIMRKEVDSNLYPKPYALPPTRSMGPYLAYELDQLRKQQKCLPQSKNLNAFENAMQSARSGKSPDHICNRYCGGSHTVTTPQQRVTRIGHFLEQWGPEIGPANDMNIRGTDGQMYKGRDEKVVRLSTDKAGGGDRPADQSQPSTPTTPGLPKPKSGMELLSEMQSGTDVQRQGSAAGKPAAEGASASKAKLAPEVHPSPSKRSASLTSKPKSGTDVSGAEKAKSGTEIGGDGEKPKSGTELQGEGTEPSPSQINAGTESPKKSGSRASVKGSKSSLQKSPSKQSGEKVEPIPEEAPAEAPPAEE